MPGSLTHRICFDGEWTEIDQRTVERAIAEAEVVQGRNLTDLLIDRLWVCYCKRLDEGAVFAVHRVGWTHVLYACAAAELGVKIRLGCIDIQDERSI